MSYLIQRASRTAGDAVFASPAATGELKPKFTFSTEGGLGNSSAVAGRQGFAPRLYRMPQVVASVSGDTVSIPNTDYFDTLADGAFDGCAVRFYRIVNDELVLAREDVVSHWFARAKQRAARFTHTGAATYTWRWSAGSDYARDVAARFAVSSVAADGSYSPVSTAVTYTTPATFVDQGALGNPTDPLFALTTENAALAAPTGVALSTENDGRVAVLTWNEVPGATGYVVWRSQYDFADLITDRVDLVGGAGLDPVQPGDMMIPERYFSTSESRASMVTHRVFYNTKYVGRPPFDFQEDYTDVTFSHLSDPAEGPVQRVVRTGTGLLQLDSLATHGGAGQATLFYPVLVPEWDYGVTIRAKGSVTFNIQRRNGGAARTRTITVNSAEWADYTVTFGPQELFTGTVGYHDIRIDGAADFEIAGMVFHRAEPGDTPLLLTPEQAALLAEAEPSFIRTCEFIKTPPWTYSLDSMTSWIGSGTHGTYSLPNTLTNIATAGASPWLQVEWVWTDADWLGLAEYLCAPYDPQTDTPATKPWASRRHAQGRTAPWIDAFPKLLIELGNENWQSLADFYAMPNVSGQDKGKANALMLERVAGLMKSSPYWSPAVDAKVEWVLGGWRKNTGWNLSNIQNTLTADYVTIADYNGGWDQGEKKAANPAIPADWARVVGNTVDRDVAGENARLLSEIQQAPAARTKPLRLSTYEAGPGYVMNGLNGAVVTTEDYAGQELIMKSVGAGTATIDAFLKNAADGHYYQNFFRFGEGELWMSHSPRVDGGVLNPPAMWVGWFNRTLLPARVAEIEALVTPRATLQADPPLPNAEVLGAYRLDREGVAAVVLCNRRTDAPVTATFLVDAPEAATLTRHAMTGGYQAHNTTFATKDAVEIVAEPLTWTRRVEATVPPGETQVYVWSTA